MKVEAFPRYGAAGTSWLRDTLPADRTELLVALLSRFNHDLRTPLNTIAGWSHLLQTSAADATRVRHVSDVFARNVREETLLLEEFVDDARALLGVLILNPADISAAEVISAAAERLAPSLDLHDVRLDAPQRLRPAAARRPCAHTAASLSAVAGGGPPCAGGRDREAAGGRRRPLHRFHRRGSCRAIGFRGQPTAGSAHCQCRHGAGPWNARHRPARITARSST